MLGTCHPATAHDATPTVPLDDPVYERLDRLDALGRLPGEVLGFRPLSRREVGRLLAAAGESAGEFGAGAREMRWFERGAIALAATNSRPDSIRRDNGLGRIDGVTHPLVAGREGLPYADGATLAFGTEHAVAPFRSLALAARTDARLFVSDDDEAGDASFRSLYARATFGNLVIQAGRDALAWGAAPERGLLLSRNARPLDAVVVTSETPYRLPWLLRHAGPTRIGLAVAALGGDRTPAHAYLVATRGSFRLHPRLELGLWDTLILGGEGAPQPTVLEILHEIFPFSRSGLDEDLSDHRIAIDTRWQLVPGQLLVYHESFLEDGFRPAPWGDGWDVIGLTVGAYLPSVGPDGTWDWRVEFTHLPAVAYRHGRWTSGYTFGRRLIGNGLGPDADGVRMALGRRRADGGTDRVALALERRDNDTWAQRPTGEEGRFGDIYRVENRPADERLRLELGTRRSLTPGVRWNAKASIEHEFDGGFPHHSAATRYFMELGLEFLPHRR
jgi:hypothetical protein